ncbi:MAG: tetratricopeptide repeat protein [Bacteroidetes bacterium]|nr:MAG: tetratricopeptide repeat protein [Bacteroidota bacterium]
MIKHRYINYIVFIKLAVIMFVGCSSSEVHLNKDYKTLIEQSEREIGLIDTADVEEKAKEHVIRASNLEQMNRYGEAILELQEGLRYDSSAVIFSAIGKCYLQLGKYEQAMGNALEGLKLDSLFIPAMEVLYQVYSYKGKLDEAITVYSQIVELEPTYFRKLTLARLYELKDADKAISMYEKILEDGENEDIMVRLAELYKNKGEYGKYKDMIIKIYENKSNGFTKLSKLAEAYFLNNNYSAAYNIFVKSDENLIEDELENFYIKYGDLLYSDTNVTSKEYIPEYLDKIDERFFSRWRIYYLGGFLADRIKDTNLTDKLFGKALNYLDTNQDVPIDIGVVYYNNKRFDKALEVFSKYENVYPDYYMYPFYIGTVYEAMDSNRKAIEPLERAAEMEDKSVVILGQLALAYNNLEDYEKSDSIYELALEVNPGDALINNNYAYSLSERGIKLDEALRMTEMAISLDSNNPSYLDTYGWIAYKLGDYKKALEYINKSIETGKASAEVYEHLGDIELKLGNRWNAIDAYKECIRMDGKNEDVRRKLEDLK